MENLCLDCENRIDVRCFCDNSLKFCYRHFGFIDSKYNKNHNFIDIQSEKEYWNQIIKFLLILKKSIISRSKTAIEVIEIATKAYLKRIQIKISSIENIIKNVDFGIFDEQLKDFTDGFLKKWDLADFIQEINKSWGLKVNNQEIFCVDNEFSSVLRIFKTNSTKFQEQLKNVEKNINLIQENSKNNLKKTCTKNTNNIPGEKIHDDLNKSKGELRNVEKKPNLSKEKSKDDLKNKWQAKTDGFVRDKTNNIWNKSKAESKIIEKSPKINKKQPKNNLNNKLVAQSQKNLAWIVKTENFNKKIEKDAVSALDDTKTKQNRDSSAPPGTNSIKKDSQNLPLNPNSEKDLKNNQTNENLKIKKIEAPRLKNNFIENKILDNQKLNEKKITNQINKNIIKKDPEPAQKIMLKDYEWKCKCGNWNSEEWIICQKCQNLKLGLSGWVCNQCTFVNENENTKKCEVCYMTKIEQNSEQILK